MRILVTSASGANGNGYGAVLGIVVASEWPFGAADAVPSVREYDPVTGQLVRVFALERPVGFRRPRGLRSGRCARRARRRVLSAGWT
jgi:hypothetical protein